MTQEIENEKLRTRLAEMAAEVERLQSVIDEANAQEHVGVVEKYPAIQMWVRFNESVKHGEPLINGTKLYAKPILYTKKSISMPLEPTKEILQDMHRAINPRHSVIGQMHHVYRAALSAHQGFDIFDRDAPIPAQQSPSVNDYEEVLASHRDLVRELDVLLNGDRAAKQASLSDLVSQVAKVVRAENAPLLATSDKVLFNGSHGHAGYVIEEQQTPAVAVPDAVSILSKAADGIENQISNAGFRNDLYDAGYLRAIKRELIKLRDSISVPSPRITEHDLNRAVAAELECIANTVELAEGSTIERQNALCHAANVIRSHIKELPVDGLLSPRITEQDVREIADSVIRYCNTRKNVSWSTDSYMRETGRDIVGKLNGDKNAQ